MTIKRWEFRAHGSDKVGSTYYANKRPLTVGVPYQYTTKAHGKWRPVYVGV